MPDNLSLPPATAFAVHTEEGRLGRLVYGRMAPNEDLVHGLEAICKAQGVHHALVRMGLGSLVDACLQLPSGQQILVEGPAVEVLSLFGELRSDDHGRLHAQLLGVVVNAAGQVLSGRLVPGRNLVFATFEVTLEEWLPAGFEAAALSTDAPRAQATRPAVTTPLVASPDRPAPAPAAPSETRAL